MTKTSTQYNFVSAFGAFFLWGGWAYYINSVEGKSIGLLSGLTQGVVSFAVTLIVVFVVTKIFNALSEKFLKLILPAIISVSCIGVFLTIIHSVVGTPHIFSTIAPSLSLAFIFCIFTAYKLSQNEAAP